MRYIQQHIQKIIDSYQGETPLSIFLKNYFKKHPILGSRDRKMLSEMAYAWYRCSKAFDEKLSFEKKLEACLFICETHVHQILQYLKPEWQGKHDYFFPQKLAFLKKEKIAFHLENLFPFDIELSKGIDKEEWLLSMLLQPRLFIRYRRKSAILIQLLHSHKIPFEQLNDNCFALPNGTKLETILAEKDYVVQDASSQKTGDYFLPKSKESWWDCCSGAGGKSLLLKDLQPNISLTVSDKRDTILFNLKKRFEVYHKQIPRLLHCDVANAAALQKQFKQTSFDHIICDVPCSGSGTWARTPEQLYFFDPKKLEDFSTLQSTIAQNVSPYLKAEGRMMYITCSVFKQENEAVIQKIQSAVYKNSTLINGISKQADSMFIATLQQKAIV